MYRVSGSTNYECYCSEDETYGEHISLEDAICTLLELYKDENSLDFSWLDSEISEWAENGDWDDDDYYNGYYGGYIAIYEEAENDNDCDREILMFRVERDPLNKTNTYSEIEFGDDINEEEKAVYLNLTSN